MTTTAPKILGTTDEVTTCDCCLRTELKKTVAIDFDGETAFFGTTCAAAFLTANFSATSEKDVRSLARKVDEAKCEAARRARQAKNDAEFARQQAVLDRMFPALAGRRAEQFASLRAMGKSLTEI